MVEANERSSSAVKEQQRERPNAAAELREDETQQARLGILQAVERNDISIEEALNLLDELES